MKKNPLITVLLHGLIWLFIAILFLPLYLALVTASHLGSEMMQAPLPYLPGKAFFDNLMVVLTKGIPATGGEPILSMLWSSLVMALLIAGGKVFFSLLGAFALVYFEFPMKKIAFSLILLTMMLPVEVRIVPTFQIIAWFGWVNTYAGLTLPLMASATATFLFRQCFKTIPNALVDAAKIDGAGPVRFFIDMLLPLAKPQIAALFIIMFVYGWNQYLWPLVITTDPSKATIVMGIGYLAGVADQVPQWHYMMMVALIALIPPSFVILVFQRWFVKGLIE